MVNKFPHEERMTEWLVNKITELSQKFFQEVPTFFVSSYFIIDIENYNKFYVSLKHQTCDTPEIQTTNKIVVDKYGSHIHIVKRQLPIPTTGNRPNTASVITSPMSNQASSMHQYEHGLDTSTFASQQNQSFQVAGEMMRHLEELQRLVTMAERVREDTRAVAGLQQANYYDQTVNTNDNTSSRGSNALHSAPSGSSTVNSSNHSNASNTCSGSSASDTQRNIFLTVTSPERLQRHLLQQNKNHSATVKFPPETGDIFIATSLNGKTLGPYSCDNCKKTFVRKDDFESHTCSEPS